MTEDSAISGVPPFTVDGAAEEGPYTKLAGLLSYPEVCAKISNPNNLKGTGSHLRKVGDPSKRYGKCLIILINLLLKLFLSNIILAERWNSTEVSNRYGMFACKFQKFTQHFLIKSSSAFYLTICTN